MWVNFWTLWSCVIFVLFCVSFLFVSGRRVNLVPVTLSWVKTDIWPLLLTIDFWSLTSGRATRFWWESRYCHEVFLGKRKASDLCPPTSLSSAFRECRRRPPCFSGLPYNERTEVTREGKRSFGPGKMTSGESWGQRLLIGQGYSSLWGSQWWGGCHKINISLQWHITLYTTLIGNQHVGRGHQQQREADQAIVRTEPSFHQWQAATYLRWPLLYPLVSLLPSMWGALGPEKKDGGVKGKIKPPQTLGTCYKSGEIWREEKKWYWNWIWYDIKVVN